MKPALNRMPAADNGTSIDALVYRDPSVAVAPDTCGLCFPHVVLVLPPQGIGVIDTCLADRFAVPFISAAVRVGTLCLFWIWDARPTSIKNSENNSVAPIESNAEFLYMIHLRMVSYVDHFLAMLHSNHHASRSCSRVLHVYPLICWIFRAAVTMNAAQSDSAINPALNLI